VQHRLLDSSAGGGADTERIIAENLESTKTITQIKLQLAEALSALDNLQHSNQLLDRDLRCAKDEAYAHTAQHRKELSSLRGELIQVQKERDELKEELQHMRRERDDARREVTRMKMLSIQQHQQRSQRRLSCDTIETAASIASSMGSNGGNIGIAGGGRRGSLLKTFCESSRNLLGDANDDASASNFPPENRRGSLTIADLQGSRRKSQQGIVSSGRLQGRRRSVSSIGGTRIILFVDLDHINLILHLCFACKQIHLFVHQANPTTNSASLALALAHANGSNISSSPPKRSSTTNLQELRTCEQSRRSSGGTQWFRRLSNLSTGGAHGDVRRGSGTTCSFENSQNSLSSILGLDRELDKLKEQQANEDDSNLMLPGRGSSPPTNLGVISSGISPKGDDDDLSEDDEDAIRNAACAFACHEDIPCQDQAQDVISEIPPSNESNADKHEAEDGEDGPMSLLASEVDAVGWTSRRKLLDEEEKNTTGSASGGAVVLGEEIPRRNSMTARNA